MSEFGREQSKGLEHGAMPESVEFDVSEEGDVSMDEMAGGDTEISELPEAVRESRASESTAVERTPIPKRETTGMISLAGRLPNLEKLLGEKKPGLKADEFKSLAEQIDSLMSAEGKLTIGDVKQLVPPETVALLSRWQLHSVRSHVRKALRKRYMEQMEAAMAKRGDISELSEAERSVREEQYAADVGKVDEVYGYADLLAKVTRYLEKDSGEKF